MELVSITKQLFFILQAQKVLGSYFALASVVGWYLSIRNECLGSGAAGNIGHKRDEGV